jgi:hypothetical protein
MTGCPHRDAGIRTLERAVLTASSRRCNSVAGYPQIYNLDPDRNVVEFNWETMD